MKFLKSQENCLKSIEFFTQDNHSVVLLKLAQDDQDNTVLFQLRKITASASIQDNLRLHYPHYNIKKLVKMFINVETFIFYFNNIKEITTLLRTFGSFKKISMIKFIDKQNFEGIIKKKYIRKINKGIAKKSRNILRRRPNITIIIESGNSIRRIN